MLWTTEEGAEPPVNRTTLLASTLLHHGHLLQRSPQCHPSINSQGPCSVKAHFPFIALDSPAGFSLANHFLQKQPPLSSDNTVFCFTYLLIAPPLFLFPTLTLHHKLEGGGVTSITLSPTFYPTLCYQLANHPKPSPRLHLAAMGLGAKQT